MKAIFGFIFVVGFILFVFVFPFTGLHIDTGSGKQVGYVSATEKSGVIWKTGTAYIKPTLESTQEDVYCVISDEVLNQLQQASVSKERVEIEHYSVMVAGIKNCSGEGAIIKSVKSVQ